MTLFIFIIVAVAYIIGTYYLIRFIRIRLRAINRYLGVVILSFVYALFFGLGILGSGGDPGFALPFPITLTALIYVWDWVPWTHFINGVIIPLTFWWFLFLLMMMIRQFIAARRTKQQV